MILKLFRFSKNKKRVKCNVALNSRPPDKIRQTVPQTNSDAPPSPPNLSQSSSYQRILGHMRTNVRCTLPVRGVVGNTVSHARPDFTRRPLQLERLCSQSFEKKIQHDVCPAHVSLKMDEGQCELNTWSGRKKQTAVAYKHLLGKPRRKWN
jgi:hypothetical protein